MLTITIWWSLQTPEFPVALLIVQLVFFCLYQSFFNSVASGHWLYTAWCGYMTRHPWTWTSYGQALPSVVLLCKLFLLSLFAIIVLNTSVFVILIYGSVYMIEIFNCSSSSNHSHPLSHSQYRMSIMTNSDSSGVLSTILHGTMLHPPTFDNANAASLCLCCISLC